MAGSWCTSSQVMAEADGVDVNTFLEMEPEYVAGYAEA
jgi:hypothetical protein